MIHPDTEVKYIDEEKGYGLFAVKSLPAGTITWIFDELDREITPADLELYREPVKEILLKYSYRNCRGNYIFCWDNGRYINHSFRANCCLTPYNFEIAIRNIEAGEELTDDYGYLNIIEPFTAAPEGEERTVVYPDDLTRYGDRWDKKIAAVFSDILLVDQPLWKYFPPEQRENIREIIERKKEMLSIKSCFYDESGQLGTADREQNNMFF